MVLLSVCLSSSSSSFGAAEQGAGGKGVRTWCGKRRRRWGEKEVSNQREVGMRLITHNMLSCNIKGVTNGYPLGIEASRLETKESELNPEFLRKIFPKLEWKALRDAAHSLGLNDLPEHVEPSMLEDEDFLKNFHHVLLEVHLEEGALICPETGRRFPVTKGVPNMLLNEDEV